MLSLGVGLTSVPVLARRGPAYDPDALAFFARLTNQPTDPRKKLYSDLITSLKTAGVWSKLDALYILAAADAQAARQNLVANAYNLTAVGSPSFTADRGYQGDGVAATLASGFNPTLAPSPKYSLNSATLFSWMRGDLNGSYTSIGITSGTQAEIRPRNAGALTARTNSTAVDTVTVATSRGLSAWSRTGAAEFRFYKDGQLISTKTTASTGLPNDQARLLSLGGFTQFSPDQIAVGGIGGGLTDADHATLYSATNIYLTAVGAA